ncbi:hypothetical protein [Neisseria sp. Ec49-e6-T10]|uniref:hypothetical protein n=1 Tax=Neisseria sp. Ec49-e6-T10 TaxID=3140744 RepID=UPI003EBD1BD0
MKRVLLSLLILSVGSTVVYAKRMPPAVIQDTAIVNELYFGKGVLNNEDELVDINGDDLSFSREKKEIYCWVAELTDQDNLEATAKIIEQFTLPAKGAFASNNPDAKISASKDGKIWTINTTEQMTDSRQLGTCWSLDENDPIGQYLLNIEINGEKQPEIKFNVVK